MFIFASDPHGKGENWINLVEQARIKYPNTQIIFGGDYIDGHPHTKQTLEYVMDTVQKANAIALLGNHEQLLLDFCLNPYDDLWYINGGKTTVKSLFGRNFSRKIVSDKIKTSKYYDFIKSLPVICQTENIIFVHAGIDNIKKLNTSKQYCLWAREKYFFDDIYTHNFRYKLFKHNLTNKTVVTGHTPTCLIEGVCNDRIIKGNEDCQVLKVKYPGEPARYFTDGGVKKDNNHNGNVCVFDHYGDLIDVI